MGEKADDRWSRAGVILAAGTFLFTVAIFGLTFAIGYTDSAGFRAWVDWLVAPVGALGPQGLGAVTSLGAGVVTGIVVGGLTEYVKRRLQGGRGWPKWRRREKRVSVGTQERMEPAGGQGEEATQDDDCRAKVRELSVAALQVLYRALWNYDQGGSSVLRLEVNDLRATWAGTTEEVSLQIVREECRDLQAAGFIKGHSAFSGKGHEGVNMPLADCLSGRPAASDVREWLHAELVERGVWAN